MPEHPTTSHSGLPATSHSGLPDTDPRVDEPIYRGLRALVAVVPIVGSGISVLIESELSARQSIRLRHLFERVAELESKLEFDQEDGKTKFSETLLESAAVSARNSTELFRARILANCLFIDSATDGDEVMRHHLIELISSLTTLELAILNREDRSSGSEVSNEIKLRLHEINLGSPTTTDLRDYSRQRLSTFGLITDPGPKGIITRIGQKLTTALY